MAQLTVLAVLRLLEEESTVPTNRVMAELYSKCRGVELRLRPDGQPESGSVPQIMVVLERRGFVRRSLLAGQGSRAGCWRSTPAGQAEVAAQADTPIIAAVRMARRRGVV